MSLEAGAAAPWKRRPGRPCGWHVIAEIDLARLLTQHGEHRRLCDALEAVADDLPNPPPAEAAMRLDGRLLAFAREAPGEEAMFARLGLEPGMNAGGIGHTLRRWRLLDALHAQDLAEMLATDPSAGSEGMAYALRCFFEGCRRTIAFGEAAILLLGASRLTGAAA